MTDSIISKIEKLLALAESDNIHEAEVAMTRATEMMRKHSIDESQLHKNKDYKISLATSEFDFPGTGRPWARKIGNYMANAFDCKALFVTFRKGSKKCFRMKLYGEKADVQTALLMLKYCFKVIKRLESLQKVVWRDSPQVYSLAVHLNSYRVGVAEGISETLYKIIEGKKRDKANGESEYGLILLSKEALVTEAFNKAHPDTRSMGSRSHASSGSARMNGRNDGSKVSFSKQLSHVKTSTRLLG
jgi:hypothetical protein